MFVVRYLCCSQLFVLFIVISCCFASVEGFVRHDEVAITIIKEPSYHINEQISRDDSFMFPNAKVFPANFSGPTQLKQLVGSCFENTFDGYHYVFCPFDNVTQDEESNRWNPYHGILGIWQEWIIVNNAFESMVMSNGDSCSGSVERSVKVQFKCGRNNKLTNVTEPSRCNYVLIFETPLVCHVDAMLVYPRLNATLQREWDVAYSEFKNKIITEKGYSKQLRSIFYRAGFQLSPRDKERLIKRENIITHDRSRTLSNFTSVEQCQRAYNHLNRQFNELKD
ncbi:GNPTG (predicted) [Pycnogonum litorale]